MADTIKTRITIEGADDIKKQLEQLGKSGEQAFGDIQKAAEDVGFDKVTAQLDDTTKATTQTAKAADQLTEAHSNLGLQAAKTVAEIAKLTTEVAQNSIAIGESVAGIVLLAKAHRSLTESFTKLVTTANSAVRALRLLAPVLTPVGVAIAGVGAAAAATAIGLEAAGEAAQKLAGPYEKLNSTLTTLAANTGQSSEQLQRGEALFKQMGVSAETFRGSIAKVAGTMKDLDVSAELQKSADSIVAANNKVLEAERALIEQRVQGRKVFLIGEDASLSAYLGDLERLKQLQAELNAGADKEKALQDALLEARQKAAEAAANSLSKVLEQVKAIEAGQKGITFDSLVKGDTIIKAVAISLKQAADNGQNAGKVLVDFIANAERAQAIEIGKKFGLTEEDVDRVKRLGGNLGAVDQVWKRIQAAGVLIPPESAAALAALRVEMDRLDAAKERLSQAWDSSFVARWAAEVNSSILSVKTFFLNLASSILESMNQAGAGMSDMAGNTVREFTKIGEATVNAAHAVGDFITSLGSITWDAIASAGVAAWDAITSAIQQAIDAFLKFIGLKAAGGGGAAAAASGKAGGGLIGGRGSGTSDSNLAWVSRGEFVISAAAVKHFGANFFAALNALQRPPGFALGGPVAMPALATGGLVGATRSVSLTLNLAGASVSGMVDEQIAEALQRVAVKQQIRSGGRKPSRYT